MLSHFSSASRVLESTIKAHLYGTISSSSTKQLTAMYRSRPVLETLLRRHTLSLLPHSSLPPRPHLALGHSRPLPTSLCALRAYSTEVKSHKSVCTSCGKPLPTPLPACPNCAHIGSIPPNPSYYELLGLDIDPKLNPFVIDAKDLQQKFRKVQMYIHPDVWASRGEVRFISPYFALFLEYLTAADAMDRKKRTRPAICRLL